MKKTLLTSMLAISALTASAQLPDGSVAPNFTGVDLNSVSHTLYDYLDQGYTVVVDVSATWCGPCWSYHGTQALKNLYINHGPAGMPGVSATTTNTIMVLKVEGDASTNTACLYGATGCNSSTQGDWVTGTPYPIIDNSSIAQTLGIGYFPTVYTIYPDRYLEESGQLSTANHVANVNNNIAAHSGTTGIDPSIFSYTGDVSTCATLNAKVRVQNKGDQSLPAGVTVEVLDGTTVLGTGVTTQALAQFAIQEVTVPVTISANTTLTLRVVNTTDANVNNNQITQAVTLAKTSGTSTITVEITTDRYGSETTWNLKKANNQTVASGGPYTDASSNGAYPKPSVLVSLANNDCYKLTVNDSYGDGMNSGYGIGFVRLVDGNGLELVKISDFLSTDFGSMKSGTYTAIEENNVVGMEVYPNPVNTTAIVTFENLVSLETSIEVTNLVGQVVINEFLGNVVGTQYVELNASELNAGIYLVNIKTGNTVTTKRIVVAK
jgi:thiol-disulfide isomerase/thioredoxin